MMTTSQEILSKQPKDRRYTLEEYFEFAYDAEGKFEFYDGEIVDISYATVNHGRINANLLRVFGNAYYDKLEISIFGRFRMLYVPHYNKVFYSDLSIIGKHEFYAYKDIHATLNPIVLVEVLKDEIAEGGYDKHLKFHHYQKMASLKYMAFIDPKIKRIYLYERIEEKKWLFSLFEEDNDVIKIADCEFQLKEAYNKVDFDFPF